MKRNRFRKVLKYVSLLAVFFVISACSNNGEIKKLNGKVFNASKGGQLVVDTVNSRMSFKGIDRVTAHTDPNKYTKEQFDKGRLKDYKNPKIVVDNGKKYLTADEFPYKLEIIDENKILDLEDDNEYTFVK